MILFQALNVFIFIGVAAAIFVIIAMPPVYQVSTRHDLAIMMIIIFIIWNFIIGVIYSANSGLF